jgi:prevent-host-death family protein
MSTEGGMAKSYSIAEARSDLPGLIHDVERGRPVEITRRGKPVAIVLSLEEYRRMASATPTFAEAYAAWRSEVDVGDLDVGPEYFSALRDRAVAREVKL